MCHVDSYCLLNDDEFAAGQAAWQQWEVGWATQLPGLVGGEAQRGDKGFGGMCTGALRLTAWCATCPGVLPEINLCISPRPPHQDPFKSWEDRTDFLSPDLPSEEVQYETRMTALETEAAMANAEAALSLNFA